MVKLTRRNLITGAGIGAVAASLRLAAQLPQRVIPISTYKFVFRPNTIQVKRGEPVVFELTAQDVFMGFSLPDFKIRTDVIPGKPQRVAFTPDKAGTFTFLCDVFCGDGHEEMHGTLMVT
jgi:cytochrome c oxidase subunit 2